MSKPFVHRCVADLAWVIQSPPIVSGSINHTRWLNKIECEWEYQHCLPALRYLDQHPAPLYQALASLNPYILGSRFECLVHYWLLISPNFECLDSHYVIQGKTQTLGEVDFFIRELASHKIIHLEVAVKFYLGTHGGVNTNDWYGTNLSDRLDIKLNRMIDHQTQLSRKYPELMPYTVDESWSLLKGRMFFPIDAFIGQSNALFEVPFDADCLKGGWVYRSQLPTKAILKRVDKPFWLATINGSQGCYYDASEPLTHSCCVAEMVNGNEINRYFVLPDLFWSAI